MEVSENSIQSFQMFFFLFTPTLKFFSSAPFFVPVLITVVSNAKCISSRNTTGYSSSLAACTRTSSHCPSLSLNLLFLCLSLSLSSSSFLTHHSVFLYIALFLCLSSTPSLSLSLYLIVFLSVPLFHYHSLFLCSLSATL